MVGSSPYTSSPTSAAAIAFRMPGVGRVTVSLRRSMKSIGSLRAEALRPSRAEPAPPGWGMINAAAVARESKAERARRFGRIVRRLEKEMPEAKIALEYQDELQLLVSVMLSAPCTDAVVNQVTTALFA